MTLFRKADPTACSHFMKLYPPRGESLHRLCCADSPTDIVSHYGPVAGESEPRAAAAKVRSEHDRATFLGHRYAYKIR